MNLQTITGRDPQTGRTLAVFVEDATIARVEEASAGSDLFLAPGLIDLQVNGCSGFDVNAPQLTPDTITQLVDVMLSQGVTSFSPTIITAPEGSICRALRIIAQARDGQPRVRGCIPFVHVEGPHISPLDGYRGAHSADAVRPPSLSEFERWQQASGDVVGLVTVSPHFEESAPYISALVGQGIHVAIGHTHASPEQIERAIGAGASLSTHLGNGIAAEIPRHRNPIWSQLADDRVSASFIADGHHLPAYVLKAMLRAKGIDRSLLVSDSVALAGMPAGEYTTPVGGRVELRPDGRLCVFGSELLAGATASLARGIGNLVCLTGLPLYEALAMATVNPGKFVPGRGQLKPGLRADVLTFRWQDEILIEDVWLAGERVFTRNEGIHPPGSQRA
jgi:N-acetylglucosamine-6-phosphate deacetylase